MVELLAAYNYLPVIIGSSVAGLVVLALIVAALYKVRSKESARAERTKPPIPTGLPAYAVNLQMSPSLV